MIGLLFDSNLQFQNKNGSLLTDGILNVYYNSSTDTKKYPAKTYSDPDGQRLNPLDIHLDNNGRALVYVHSDYAYRLEVFDADRNLLWTTRGIQPNNGIAIDGTKIISINGDENISVVSKVDGSRYSYQLGLQDEVKEKLENIVTKDYVDRQDNNILKTLNTTAYDLQMQINTKQDHLKPGDHIEITNDNTINVVGEFGKVYTGISPVNVDNVNDEISVSHKTLKVESPLTFDKSNAVLGFDDSAYAKKTDIPTDFYTKSEVDGKVTTLQQGISTNASNIANNTATIAELDETVIEHDQRIDANKEDIRDLREKLLNNYYDKEQIDGFLKNWSGYVVIPLGGNLPAASEADLGKIYLWKKAEAAEKDNFEEWISDGSTWSKIGTMEANLDNYYTKTEVDGQFTNKSIFNSAMIEVHSSIDKKLNQVETDGTTITGNGTKENPLVAHAAEPDSFELVQGTYIKLEDDEAKKQTKINDSALVQTFNTINSSVRSLGQEVNGVSNALLGKQNKVTYNDYGYSALGIRTISAPAKSITIMFYSVHCNWKETETDLSRMYVDIKDSLGTQYATLHAHPKSDGSGTIFVGNAVSSSGAWIFVNNTNNNSDETLSFSTKGNWIIPETYGSRITTISFSLE